MSSYHVHLWCIGLLVLGCGDENPMNESSDPTTAGSTDTNATTESETNESESTDDSTPPECGDGIVEGDEVCDLDDLADATCISQGFDSGPLGCAPDCLAYD